MLVPTSDFRNTLPRGYEALPPLLAFIAHIPRLTLLPFPGLGTII